MVIGLQAGRKRNSGSFAGRKKMRRFSSPQRPEQLWRPQLHIQTVPEGLSTVVKWPGRDADYSLPSGAKVEGTRIEASDPPHAFKSFK